MVKQGGQSMKKKGLTEDHIFAGAAYLLTGIMAVACLDRKSTRLNSSHMA